MTYIAFHPTECSCTPLAYGEVTYFDEQIKSEVTRTIATLVVRHRDCPIHAAHDRSGRAYNRFYLDRFVGR
jgi:hypothetical protein